MEAPFSIEVQVTQEHIDNGTSACSSCPIALALSSKGFKYPSVDHNTVKIPSDDGTMVAWLPQSAANFVYHYDRGNVVDPFKFHLTFRNRVT